MNATRHLLIAATLVAAAGCGYNKAKEPPPKPFFGTRWEVVLELPMKGEQPSFRLGDGRIEGFGGCNRFNARYLQDSVGARAIAIGVISTSKRFCDDSTMAAERRVLEVLQSVSSYLIIADTMVMSGSGGSLNLKAVPDAP
jgi:heat shock protein HslJ